MVILLYMAEAPQTPDIINKPQEAGAQNNKEGGILSGLKESFFNRVTQAKERFNKADKGRKETVPNLDGAVIKGARPEFRGRTPDGKWLVDLVGGHVDNVRNAEDKLNEKNDEIKEQTLEKKDEAASGFQDKVRGLWTKANDKLVKPQVEKAREVASKVKGGGENIKNYFGSQAETARNDIREIASDWVREWKDVFKLHEEIKSGILGGKLTDSANNSRGLAQEKSLQSLRFRAAENVFRGGATALGKK